MATMIQLGESAISGFEGTEKKLEIDFVPRCDVQIKHSYSIEQNTTSLNKKSPRSVIGHGTPLKIPHINIPNNQEILNSSPPSLLNLEITKLHSILALAGCSILSTIHNNKLIAHLLSESSLFLYPQKIIIKTCGATTLLRALESFLQAAMTCGLAPSMITYSHAQYLFPTKQPTPHHSFSQEISYLEKVVGQRADIYTLGNDNAATVWLSCSIQIAGDSKWSRFVSKKFTAENSKLIDGLDHQDDDDDDGALSCSSVDLNDGCVDELDGGRRRCTTEIFMYELDREVMEKYMNNTCEGAPKEHGGIDLLIPKGSKIDSWNFLPCGYSMNAFCGEWYYTVHITPENDCSYVSFETNDPEWLTCTNVSSVVKYFRPGRFAIGISMDGAAQKTTFYDSDSTDDLPGSWCSSDKNDETFPKKPEILADLDFIRHLTEYEQDDISDTCTLKSDRQVAFLSFRKSGSTGLKPRILNASEIDSDCVGSSVESDDDSHSVSACIDALSLTPENITRFFSNCESDKIVDSVRAAIESNDTKTPVFVLDLKKLKENVLNARRVFGGAKLNYAVRCNADDKILSILHLHGVSFNAANAADIQSLRAIKGGVTDVAFVTPLVTQNVMRNSDIISTFAMHSEGIVKSFLLKAECDERRGIGLSVGVSSGAYEETLMKVRSLLDDGFSIVSFFLENHCSDLVGTNSIKKCKGRKSRDTILLRSLDDLFSIIRKIMSLEPRVSKDTQVYIGQHYPGAAEGIGVGFSDVKRLAGELQLSVDVSRYLVGSSATYITTIVSRRICSDTKLHMYFLNDGVYGALSAPLMERKVYTPVPYRKQSCGSSSTAQKSVIFGPTCDSLDCLWHGELPVLQIGDIILWENVGAYSSSLCTPFNGFGTTYKTCYIVQD